MTPRLPLQETPVLGVIVWCRNGVPVYASPDLKAVLIRVRQKVELDMKLAWSEVTVKEYKSDRFVIQPKQIIHPEIQETWLLYCVEAD